MKILVTGGSGVVGAAVIPELLKAGHQVRLLSRHAGNDAHDYPAGDVESFPADITEPSELRGAADTCDVVLHIAGIAEEQPPHATFEKVNVGGTRNVLAVARRAGLPRFIFLSSLGADRGTSDYHRSKLRGEELVRDYAGPWLILRPGNIYGPGDETVSMLVKMNRTLPAVPLVDQGDDPFQPLWYKDFGYVVARALERPELDRTVLDLAGPEITTTNDLLDRIAAITGRNPARIQVPAWITRFGTTAAESFGALGARLLRQAGIEMSFTKAKLQMLLEGSLIQDDRKNALLTVFQVPGTHLQEGLEILADLQPETDPTEGVGLFQRTTYFADIEETSLTPASLMDFIREHLSEIMPLEVAAEPRAASEIREGSTLTITIPVRGNVQLRLEHQSATRMTFVTVSGRPLAGALTLEAEPASSGVRFSIRIIARPANVFDWITMRTIGGVLQAENWRSVVRRVVRLSSGHAPRGIKREARILSEAEAREFKEWTQTMVQDRKRAEQTREQAPDLYPDEANRRE